MARKIRTSKTPEQRKAEAEELHATIATEVENLRVETNWTRFLDFSRHMNRYSLNNLLLILAANPEATAVAGYRTWQERGYQVRKGEKAIRIFGGRSVSETVEDPDAGDEAEKRRMLYFAVPVFDISQCDPIDPSNAVAPVVAARLTGEDPAGIYEAVADYLTSQGWTVTREPIPGETNGYTTMDGSQRIVIDSDLSPSMQAKVALHEAAHASMHVNDGVGEYVAHRGIKETEAESVAYVVAGMLGLNTAEYSIGYVASWSDCDPQVIKDTAARVLRCAHALADALTADPDGPDDSPTVGLERPAVTELNKVAADRVASPRQDGPYPGSDAIDRAAAALMARLAARRRELMEAVVSLGANSRWDSSAIEVLAGPIQRAAIDAGLPAFGSTGADGATHAFYGRLALRAGLDTDWGEHQPPEFNPSPSTRDLGPGVEY